MSNQIVKALEHGAQKLGKTLAEDAGKAVKDFYRKTGDNLKKVAHNHRETDAKHAAELKKILGGGKNDLPHAPHAPRGGGRSSRGGPSLGGPSKGGQRSEGNRRCRTGGDPVDVVSGQMIMSKTDLELPGLLPLVLRRSYASDYCGGQWFGPGWSSTLDQRVQIDDTGIHFAGDDSQILHYPLPAAPGEQVLPLDGARWPLTWDESTDTIRIEDLRTGWVRHFEGVPEAGATRPLSALTDRNGHRIDHLYDDGGLPAEIHHSGGYRVAADVIHTAAGPRIEALRLLDGTNHGLGTTVVSYGYDARGRLAEITDSSGAPLVYGYDSRDRVTSWTDRNGFWYQYEYGPDGRVIRGHGSNGALDATFAYDDLNRVNTVTDSLGRRTCHHYDEQQHIIRTVDAAGHTVDTQHDRYGHLLAHADALGRTTRFSLDPNGDPIRIERPDGSSLSAWYNSFQQPVKVQAPDGATWRHAYDAAGNQTEVTDPAGATTRFGYDDAGRLSTVTDVLGSTTNIQCNQAGLVVESTDALGGRTLYQRDAFGRPVAVTDPLGQTTRYSWTIEGRPVSRTAPDGSVEYWAYDLEGNTLTHTDQVGGVTAMEYTHFNKLATTTGPDGNRYTFAYNAELQLTQVANPQGLTWTYTHDPVGRVAAETDFNGRTLSYTHDAAGRLASRMNGLGQTITHTYDLLGNLVAKDADGEITTYSYDQGDRLVQAASPTVELTRRHDVLGRLVAETINGRTVSFEYDLLGRRISRRTPSGSLSTWTYDGAGRPSTLTTGGHTVRFERDALGRETTRHLNDQLALVSAWDTLHRLTAQSLVGAGSPSTLQHRAYTYRPDGRLTDVTDQHSATHRFDLDLAGRVTAVHAAGWSERYVYDSVGNLTDASWPARDDAPQGARTYHGTLIQTAGRLSYQHDAQGRVTTRRQTTLSGRVDFWRYTWDAEDRLTAATTPDGAQWRYLYDPFGRRIAKQHLTGAGDDATVVEWTDFTWDATTLAEQTAHSPHLPGPYTLTWDHRGLHPIAQTEHLTTPDTSQEEVDRRFFAIITDLIGTPTCLLNPDGTTAWKARTTLWGTTANSKDSTTSTPLRFPGQYYDPETRLHYNVHRYYDPTTARYLTSDPLGLVPAPNPHSYVANPLRAADPLGLAEQLPLGEHGNPFPSRGDAERKAFDLAGVPYGTVPDEQWQIGNDVTRRGAPGYVYDTEPTHWGEMRQFETPKGSRLVIEHTGDPAGPHFHAGMPKGRGEDAFREGVNFGWGGSDVVRDGFERYQKIDKPGGDHHLFYQEGSQCPG
ncbi:DUF6531 domain-containing protein [Saccharothrix sp. ST-888]|uniref:DUF6531 domain-containing protein n=1 Tax=Saccharothrix sp. ST-888 TaxID=1427391 RepID=UPI0005ED0633|nr:DUF6531 domain-containing protein [Saccharothrix sp. ST-888]